MIHRVFTNRHTVVRHCALALMVLLAALPDAFAQPVDRYIRLEAPASSVAHDASPLTGSKPRIAILRSQQTIDTVTGGERLVEDAVHHWELLLLGLRIPYVLLEDADLNRKIPDSYRVLVLPAAEALSRTQRQRIREYVRGGGGVISSGRTGYFDEGGARMGGAFLESIFEAEYVDNLPAQPHGMYQVVESGNFFTSGMAPGFRFNVRIEGELSAVRDRTGTPLGPIETFDHDDQAHFNRLSLVLLGESPGNRYLWTRFHPQDVSRTVEQQENYQRLVINALAYLSGSTTVSIADWPAGYASALSIVALPSPGFEPFSFHTNVGQFARFMNQREASVTYFVTSEEIAFFPDLLRTIVESDAEIALSADTDRMLTTGTVETRIDRLVDAQTQLGLEYVHGVFPPGGFLDTDVIRALDRVGAAYVMQFGQEVYAPQQLDWWDFADHADAFHASTSSDLSLRGQSSQTQTSTGPSSLAQLLDRSSAPKNPPVSEGMALFPDMDILPITDKADESIIATFDRINRAGGFYALPLYPEEFRPYLPWTNELEGVLDRARAANTWQATTSDVALWWRSRQNVRPSIVFRGDRELRIDLEKTMDARLDSVVLEIHLPGVVQENLTVTGAGNWLSSDLENESVRVAVHPLIDRTTRINLTWDR